MHATPDLGWTVEEAAKKYNAGEISWAEYSKYRTLRINLSGITHVYANEEIRKGQKSYK